MRFAVVDKKETAIFATAQVPLFTKGISGICVGIPGTGTTVGTVRRGHADEQIVVVRPDRTGPHFHNVFGLVLGFLELSAAGQEMLCE